MEILDFGISKNINIAVALGFFDSVHVGHRKVIAGAVNYANNHFDVKSAVFTFRNNPFEYLNNRSGVIYTFAERVELIRSLGVDYIIVAEFDRSFCNLTADEFLRSITHNFQVKYVTCGMDYRFGSQGAGDVTLLKQDAKTNGYELEVFEFVERNGGKISSSSIRQGIMSGDIAAINSDLGSPYHVSGVVVSGRREGRRIGVPTVNIVPDSDKVMLKEGVYITAVEIEGRTFRGVTNVGTKPTYEDYTHNIETHIIGYSGDLYGHNLKILFLDRLRDVIKYETIEALVARINEDITTAQQYQAPKEKV